MHIHVQVRACTHTNWATSCVGLSCLPVLNHNTYQDQAFFGYKLDFLYTVNMILLVKLSSKNYLKYFFTHFAADKI